jgi:hypothetical protein
VALESHTFKAYRCNVAQKIRSRPPKNLIDLLMCSDNWIAASFAIWRISQVNTVAFLPTAGILGDMEGVYLLENKWSGREDLNLRPPGPEPGALPG